MHSKASENSILELRKFTSTATHAIDLYNTLEHLLNYCFGARNLFQVFSKATEDTENLEECRLLIQELYHFVMTDLRRLIVDRTSYIYTRDDEQLLVERIKFLFEIYGCRVVENLMSTDMLTEVDNAIERVEQFLGLIDVSICNKLPHNIRSHFNRGSPILKKRISPVYTRDERPIVEVKPFSLEEENRKNVMDHISNICDKLESGTIDISSMNAFIKEEYANEFRILPEQSQTAFKRLFALLETVLGHIDVRVRDGFLGVMEKVLKLTKSEHKSIIFDLLLEKHNTEKVNILHSYDGKIMDYSERVTDCLNCLGDHHDIHKNAQQFANVQQKLQFLLLLAPFPTLHHLLRFCIEKRSVVPAVLRVLQTCPSLFNFYFVNEDEKVEAAPLAIMVFEKIVQQDNLKLDDTETQDNFVYLVASMCRRRQNTIKYVGPEGQILREIFGEMQDTTLIDSFDFLNRFLFKYLISPRASLSVTQTMLRILQRILQSLGDKETEFRWTSDMADDWIVSKSIPAPELLVLILQYYSQYEGIQQPLADSCRSILKNLGDKLKEDNVVFPPKSRDYVLSELTKKPWWVRYYILSNYSHSMEDTRQQVPPGLFYALSTEDQQKLDMIIPDFEGDPVCCFLKSLFELALFDLDMAKAILDGELALKPCGVDILDKVSLTLADCVGRSFQSVRVAALVPFLDTIVEKLGPVELCRGVKLLSKSTFYALEQSQPVLIISNAAQIAFGSIMYSGSHSLSHAPEDSLDGRLDSDTCANLLLQAFCEVAKSKMEEEMIKLRRNGYGKGLVNTGKRIIPEGTELMKFTVFETQLNILFTHAVIFTQLVGTNVPPCLRVLINILTDYTKEIMDKQVSRYLDDVKLPSFKSDTVYAYANNSHKAHHNQQPHQSHQNHASTNTNGSYCAENNLFSIINDGSQPSSSSAANNYHHDNSRPPRHSNNNNCHFTKYHLNYREPHSIPPHQREQYVRDELDRCHRQQTSSSVNNNNNYHHQHQQQQHDNNRIPVNNNNSDVTDRRFRNRQQSFGNSTHASYDRDQLPPRSQNYYATQYHSMASQIGNDSLKRQTENRLSQSSAGPHENRLPPVVNNTNNNKSQENGRFATKSSSSTSSGNNTNKKKNRKRL